MRLGLPSLPTPPPPPAIVVSVYQSMDPKKAAKEFEKDANDMLAKGYEVLSVVGTANKTGAAAIGLGAYSILTVTYRRLPTAA